MTERITWRGSHASAQILADRVNNLDARFDRGGYHPRSYATAEASISGINSLGQIAPVRDTSVCIVDAYDGRHYLGVGDTLVATDDGWRVDSPGDGS